MAVAVGFRLCPCAVIGWPSLCALRLLPAGCGLWWAVLLWPMAYGLEAVPLVGAVLVRLSACALVGAMGGVYIKLPGDYTGHIKPLPARLAVSPAAPFRRLHGCHAGGWRRAAIAGRRSCRLPVHLSGGPGALLAGVCLLSAGLPELPAATERATENAGESAPDFPGPPAGRLPPPVHVQGAPPASRLAAAPVQIATPEAAKISSDFSGEGFYARGLSLAFWYINAPL